MTRFCRALGCDSVRDFKVQAGAEPGGRHLLYASSRRADRTTTDVASVADRVLGSVDRGGHHAVRKQLDTQALRQAIETIATRAAARHLRRRRRLARGRPRRLSALLPARPPDQTSTATPICSACRPPPSAAGDCRASRSATAATIREVLERRRDRAGTTAPRPSRSPSPTRALARPADIALALINVPEDRDIFKPTASRIAHIAVIDVIATGVADAPRRRRRIEKPAPGPVQPQLDPHSRRPDAGQQIRASQGARPERRKTHA